MLVKLFKIILRLTQSGAAIKCSNSSSEVAGQQNLEKLENVAFALNIVFALNVVPILSSATSFPFLLLAAAKTFLASSIRERAISHLEHTHSYQKI